MEMAEKHAQLKQDFASSKASTSAAKRDAAWLDKIANQQDPQALSDLFELYDPKLKGWLMARGVGDGTAEDIVQDVMIKVWTHASLFDPQKASFATWVYRLTRNKWIDHQRKHGRMDVRDPERMRVMVDDEIASAEDAFITLESSVILREHIAGLTEAQRQAIQMAFFEFKTHKQMSAETGLPLGTVKTRIRSAMKALRASLAQQEDKLR